MLLRGRAGVRDARAMLQEDGQVDCHDDHDGQVAGKRRQTAANRMCLIAGGSSSVTLVVLIAMAMAVLTTLVMVRSPAAVVLEFASGIFEYFEMLSRVSVHVFLYK